MPTIRLTQGTHNPLDGDRIEQGDTVELSEDVLDGLPDEKYEYVQDDSDDSDDEEEEEAETEVAEEEALEEASEEAEPEAEVAEEPEDIEAEEAEQSDEDVADLVPDDYGDLSSMASHYDGSAVHGAMSQEDISSFFETLSEDELRDLRQAAGVDEA